MFRNNTFLFADGTKKRIAKGIPVPGDYDGDRKADCAVYRSDGRRFGQIELTGNYSVPGSIASELIPVPADYDSDCRTDPAIFIPKTGEWLVLKPNSKAVKFGKDGDIPVPGNYGGGRKAIPAVIRNGKLIVLNRKAILGLHLNKGQIASSLLSVRTLWSKSNTFGSEGNFSGAVLLR